MHASLEPVVEQQLVVDQLVGDIGRNRSLRQATLRRRQALPECGVGLGDQWIGTPRGGLVLAGTAMQGHTRHYAGTAQVTQRTRGGPASAKVTATPPQPATPGRPWL